MERPRIARPVARRRDARELQEAHQPGPLAAVGLQQLEHARVVAARLAGQHPGRRGRAGGSRRGSRHRDRRRPRAPSRLPSRRPHRGWSAGGPGPPRVAVTAAASSRSAPRAARIEGHGPALLQAQGVQLVVGQGGQAGRGWGQAQTARSRAPARRSAARGADRRAAPRAR